MINIGIIGFGKMGQIRAHSVELSGKAKVKFIYEENTLPNGISYTIAENANEVIKDPDIDAIFICTPNYLNKPLTIQALEAGKHVFCEKPPAFNSNEVEEIIVAEKKSGKKLMYGFNHRHHESIRHMKKMIDSNEYGKLLWMRGRYGKSVDKTFFDTWRAKKDLAGGGIMLDQGIHMLDLFIMFGGEYDSVQADVSNLYWNLEIEDNVFAIYKNTITGVVASLHSTMTQWRHLFSLEVFLEEGYLVLNGLKTSSGTYGDEVLSIAKNRSTAPAATWKDEEHITFPTDISWASEVKHFLDAVKNDTPIQIGSSADALAVMKLVDKTYEHGV
ncbi:MAG: Gfo/Idh/MocA family oxidoreductase [Candidatus Marinimicrobia bacterium]|jgi:1,5-anhydro-D-fructose reductase (1,5-anhydro-D-mannitol-forming)|nr:Gfo/Idh/MocA family oxidoreductase [Candidatus Neomarinimicrobiota bacterium]